MKLESQRLLLVPLQFTDTNDLFRGIRDSLTDLSRWLPWATSNYNLRDAQDFVARTTSLATEKKVYTFAVKRHDGTFCGAVDLRAEPDVFGHSIPAFTIGYWMRAAMARNGYATEAVQRLTRYAFEDLHAHRVSIECDALNTASARVAEKAGFIQEARLKNTRKGPGTTLSDTLIYAQTR